MRLFQPETFVGLAGAVVVGFHVKAQAANVGPSAREGLDVAKERAKNAIAPESFDHIYTLDPPKSSIPPIAPFARDQQLPRNRSSADGACFGHEIATFGGIAQERSHTRFDALGVEPAFFGFPGHARVELGNDGGIGQFGLSNFYFDAAW